jgi:hypothetical protein
MMHPRRDWGIYTPVALNERVHDAHDSHVALRQWNCTCILNSVLSRYNTKATAVPKEHILP